MTNMRTLGISALASVIVTAAALLTAPPPGSALTMAQARLVATKHVTGVVTKVEFARHWIAWRYLFNIRHDRVVRRIEVDAASGKIVEDVATTPSRPFAKGKVR